jgi:glutathione S-transferase
MNRVASYFQRGSERRAAEAEAAVAIPPERMAQVYAVLRRRVSDAVEDAFRRACLAGDTATAQDLIVVLDGMIRRGERLPAGERRLLPGRVARLRRELERCLALQAEAEGEAELREPG